MDSRLYDLLMRLPVLCLSLWMGWHETASLRLYVIVHPFYGGDLPFLAGLLARLGVLVFLGFLLSFHVMRLKPLRKYEAWRPKLVALAGVSLIYLVPLLPRAKPDYVLDFAASLFTLTGSYLCLISISSLGRSISVMPEARALVTSGLYSRIRHPLYLSEFVAMIGLFLEFRSWQAALILAAVFFFQVKRMDWEEKILAEAFPEYSAYRLKTWRLLPGVY